MARTIQLLLTLTLCAYLLGCGTDSSSGSKSSKADGTTRTPGVTITTSDGTESDRSSFSMRLTDAPVDGLTRVVLQFTAVELKLQSGGWTKYTLPKPQPIDLLALQGLTTADLLVKMPIEPGDYQQVRFILDDTPMANYVEMIAGGVKELDVPKAATHGLTVKQKFTIPDNRLVNFTVDFDLRKSVRSPGKSGKFKFKAKMRLVVNGDVGFIRGAVKPALLVRPSCSDMNVDTHNAVYLYRGHGVAPGDINELSTSTNQPYTTTSINYDPDNGKYSFDAAFLPDDDYTVAFTCNADLDDLEADDDLKFFRVQNVTVLVNDTTFLKP